MKECVTPTVSAPTRQLLNLILGNVNSQFMKECGILIFKHYDPDCKGSSPECVYSKYFPM